MATPKLKLHSLSDERPAPDACTELLTFVQSKDASLSCVGFKRINSDYIQCRSIHDSNRFYVSTNEIAAFLTTHNLVELPVSKEQRVYHNTLTAWIAALDSRTCNTPYYHSLRKAFFKFHVEQAGYTFSDALYTNCCCGF